ncbi:NUDIX hydrolase [Undibacterium sp. TS12]|uniref:NUDIX hydrolase n=1 Tax=Undibacterium sp. TS12 TaxID=2908202 RepID=UPI001F4C6B74|nr:NUDIX hydrolase [Undibacterium sp. TS12]MCH8618490.1 NUDIX hydrolase [Undibacterium sp. TS12]
MDNWKIIKSSILITDQWLKLRADQCQLSNGQMIDPYYVIDEPDNVHIFAVNEQSQVLTVTQYRHGVGRTCLELPGGALNHGETPLAAAQRELREETSYIANKWTTIGRMFTNPARQTSTIHVFLAEEISSAGSQNLDVSEDIQFNFLPIADVGKKIQEGQFSQALHIASYYRCLHYLRMKE